MTTGSPAHDPPETMRAVVLTGHGGLDRLEHRDDVPVATPEAGEVLLEVSACGMNNTDVWVRAVSYTHLTLPTNYSV